MDEKNVLPGDMIYRAMIFKLHHQQILISGPDSHAKFA